MSGDDRRRIDKWLWFARFARTRTMAQGLVLSGHVRLNREKVDSAAQSVRIGDVLTVAGPGGVRIARIVALGERRGPFAEAKRLYDDLSPPPEDRNGPDTPRPEGRRGPRPEKRDRRAIDRLRSSAASSGDFSGNDDELEY